MIRLHVVAEGQTEETFVNTALVSHFADFGVFTDVRCVETSRSRGRVNRGGIREYAKLRNDLVRWMRQDDHAEVWFTTMIDLYGLPRDFPQMSEIPRDTEPYRRVRRLERAFRRDVRHPRFVPYIQLHEFEALILVDPNRLESQFLNRHREIASLAGDIAATPPETVDDGVATAPSKRIIARIPEYAGRKASAGPLIACSIGLPALRAACLHFGRWVRSIEHIGRCSAVRTIRADEVGQ